MLISENKITDGSIEGGSLEIKIIQMAFKSILLKEPSIVNLNLTKKYIKKYRNALWWIYLSSIKSCFYRKKYIFSKFLS